MSENRQLYKYGWGKPQPLWLGKKKQERLEPYGSPSLRFEDDGVKDDISSNSKLR